MEEKGEEEVRGWRTLSPYPTVVMVTSAHLPTWCKQRPSKR